MSLRDFQWSLIQGLKVGSGIGGLKTAFYGPICCIHCEIWGMGRAVVYKKQGSQRQAQQTKTGLHFGDKHILEPLLEDGCCHPGVVLCSVCDWQPIQVHMLETSGIFLSKEGAVYGCQARFDTLSLTFRKPAALFSLALPKVLLGTIFQYSPVSSVL